MPLTEKDVHYVAELAHLELTEEEVKKFVPQLDAILAHMQKLNELDTSRVEPMPAVTYPAAENPALREDETLQCLDQDTALSASPEQGAGYFKVPRVIEKE